MGDILERLESMPSERRHYALLRLVQHLYDAQEWFSLFEILDMHQYGWAKLHYDLSTFSYAQDLMLGQQAAAWEGWPMSEGVIVLPHLWRYTLLRCSLISRSDKYPLAAFGVLQI